ncbi:energy-coupling factor ABC transporter ATP-binding protein [Ruminococcus sp. OA3]|uniref:ABC transporter ATP-binding protein n=1 Tax=Ruminococcus sp. OA3 TaxID=2914164 RepID=UPI001F062AD9|nr:energy-coupling factor ABC transporter ATP-binding protein [Ruminococcus sp. OA3]MCH1981743.1 energy-coupling factor ABC transporter ATP-binding protein [Ruminococcus sp. OA3]
MIELKHVTFWYENVPENVYSIRDINLTIQKGECVVLCGRSGCGKTTITRLINGLIPHYYEGNLSGHVSINRVEIKNQQLSKISQHVGSVFQNPRSQFFNVDTTAELAFGCENQGLPKENVLDRIEEAANRFSLNGLLNRSIFELSGGEKQRIACASVYAVHPDIFVLDEPSSNLDPVSILQLKDVLLKLKAEGKTLVISEHRLYYLMDIADHFVCLDQGEIRSVYKREEIAAFNPAQISAMGLRALNLNQVDLRTEPKSSEYSGHEFAFQNLNCKISGRSVLHIESLRIPAGEIIAVIGHNGAGKSTLAGCLCGIRKHTGRVLYDKTERTPQKRLKESYMVMQDVNHQLFTESVRDEVMLNIPEEQAEQAESILSDMGIDELADCHPLALSGGQKQRVAIASALCAGKKILIYDEPTSGLDYESMRSACTLIQEVSQRTELSLVITHDLEFIMSCCTFVLHIDHGTVKAFYPLDSKGKARVKEEFLLCRESEEEL